MLDVNGTSPYADERLKEGQQLEKHCNHEEKYSPLNDRLKGKVIKVKFQGPIIVLFSGELNTKEVPLHSLDLVEKDCREELKGSPSVWW